MFFNKFITQKEKAIEKANSYFSDLQSDVNKERTRLKEEYKKSSEKFASDVVLTPKEYLDYIYSNANFKDYLQYALVIKSIDKKIFLIKFAIIALSIAIAIVLGIIGVPIIIPIILAIVAIVIVLIQKKGMSYEHYYLNTISKLLISILPGYQFKEIDTSNKKQNNRYRYLLSDKYLTDSELHKSFSHLYNYFKETNTLCYNGNESNGFMCDLEIYKKVEHKNKQTGNIEVSNEKIFDGFFVKNKIQKPANKLKEYMIAIREDENLFSALTEDTINSIYSSEKNFTFNTEELNKALDCKIKYENIVDKAVEKTVDLAKNAINKIAGEEKFKTDGIVENAEDPVHIMHEVITPSFEDRLMYLRKRYNSFNMNLADSYISFNVSLKKSLFQKFKSNEILGNKYKDQTKDVCFVKPTTFSNADFEYYRIFPMLEKIFFIHYLNLLYKYALEIDIIDNLEVDIMDRFEKEMLEIIDGDYSEFKNLYKDDLKSINENVKDLEKSL